MGNMTFYIYTRYICEIQLWNVLDFLKHIFRSLEESRELVGLLRLCNNFFLPKNNAHYTKLKNCNGEFILLTIFVINHIQLSKNYNDCDNNDDDDNVYYIVTMNCGTIVKKTFNHFMPLVSFCTP